MDAVTNKNRKLHIAKTAIAVIVLIAYGAYSAYTLYCIVPDKITEYAIVKAVFGLGGTVAAFVPLGLYLSIEGRKNEKVPRYLYTVLISLFAIPIMIYGVYLIKLQNIRNYSIDSARIRYRLSTDYTVNGIKPDQNTWEVYYTDSTHNKIDDTEIMEVGRYDIINYLVNINCKTHYIEDREFAAANYDDHTVQRVVTFCLWNNRSFDRTISNDVVVYDESGSEIKIGLSVKVERVLSAWDVLLAKKITDEKPLDRLNMIGKDCSTLSRDYWNLDGEIYVDDDTMVVSYDGDCRLVLYDELLDRDVSIELIADDSGYYEAVRVYTLDPLSGYDSAEYYDKLLELAKKKYGSMYDDYSDNNTWFHRTEDMLYMTRREPDEEQEGHYGVGLLIAFRNDAEHRFSETEEQPDEETSSGEADSAWEEWGEEE